MSALAAARPEEFRRLPDIAYRIRQNLRHVSLINPRDSGLVPTHEALAAIRALPSYAHTVMAYDPEPLRS